MFYICEFLSFIWKMGPGVISTSNFQYLELEDEYHTEIRDLYAYPIPIAIGILFFRFTVEKYCFYRLGASFGLKNFKNKKPIPNLILEKAFKSGSRWTHKDIMGLAKRTDVSERQIERWLRSRKLQDKPSPLCRFSESCWCCFYSFNIFIYGFIILWPKPWFWNLDYCWANYPYQTFTIDIWWYYMFSLAFYWSNIVAPIFNVRQKDFWCTLLHNIIAVSLLSFSWICNTFRIGAIVLLLYQVADALISASKAMKYVKHTRLCSSLFWAFILTWGITKLIYYPLWILHRYQINKIFPYVKPFM